MTVWLCSCILLPSIQFAKIILEIFLAFLCCKVLLHIVPFLELGDTVVSLEKNQWKSTTMSKTYHSGNQHNWLEWDSSLFGLKNSFIQMLSESFISKTTVCIICWEWSDKDAWCQAQRDYMGSVFDMLVMALITKQCWPCKQKLFWSSKAEVPLYRICGLPAYMVGLWITI